VSSYFKTQKCRTAVSLTSQYT